MHAPIARIVASHYGRRPVVVLQPTPCSYLNPCYGHCRERLARVGSAYPRRSSPMWSLCTRRTEAHVWSFGSAPERLSLWLCHKLICPLPGSICSPIRFV